MFAFGCLWCVCSPYDCELDTWQRLRNTPLIHDYCMIKSAATTCVNQLRRWPEWVTSANSLSRNVVHFSTKIPEQAAHSIRKLTFIDDSL